MSVLVYIFLCLFYSYDYITFMSCYFMVIIILIDYSLTFIIFTKKNMKKTLNTGTDFPFNNENTS